MKSFRTNFISIVLVLLLFFLFGEARGQRFQPWAKRANMPFERNSLVGSVYNGKIYLFGGNGTIIHSRSNKIVIYDPATNLWTIGTDAPTSSSRGSGHAFVAVNDKLYTFGGEGPTAGTWNNQVAAYNSVSNAWEIKNNWASPRNSMAPGVINGKVYLAGGRTGYGATLAINQEYDPATDTWLTKAPLTQHRIPATSAVYNNKLYVFGGNSKTSESQNTALTSVEVYDPSLNTWENKSPLPFSIYNGRAVIKEDNVYLLTSPITEGNLFTHLLKYDPIADTWDILSENEGIEVDGSLVQYNERSFYFGGLDSTMSNSTIFTSLSPQMPIPFDSKIKFASGTVTQPTIGTLTIRQDTPYVKARPGLTLDFNLTLETTNNHSANSVAPLIGVPSWGDNAISFWTINSWIATGTHSYSTQKTIALPTEEDTFNLFFAVTYDIGGAATASLTNYTGSAVWNDGVDVADWNKKQASLARDSGYTYTLYSSGGKYYNISCAAASIKIITDSSATPIVSVPVELTSLTAVVYSGIVRLEWQTATEKNNKGFDIQRKIGTNWQSIGFVNGNGTSTETNKYCFLDNLSKLTMTGSVFYRLSQVDYDGTATLSKEIEVSFNSTPTSFELSQNYPNPFNPSTAITYALPFASNVKLIVYNALGQVVKELVNEVMVAGNHKIDFDGATLSSGVYFYSMNAQSLDGKNNFSSVKKLLLLK